MLSGKFLDEHGQPVKRTKYSHPYNYDSFVTWQTENADKATGCDYTDRLLHWDWDKHNKLCQKYFDNEGQRWGNREPAKIEAWLREYWNNDSIRLVRIMEHCNQSSGFPLWSLHYIATWSK